MSGHFEVLSAPGGGYTFRLVDSSGKTRAASGTYPTKQAVAAAIAVVREIAGTGLVRDWSKNHHGETLKSGNGAAHGPTIRNGRTKFPSPAAHSLRRNHRDARAHT